MFTLGLAITQAVSGIDFGKVYFLTFIIDVVLIDNMHRIIKRK